MLSVEDCNQLEAIRHEMIVDKEIAPGQELFLGVFGFGLDAAVERRRSDASIDQTINASVSP